MFQGNDKEGTCSTQTEAIHTNRRSNSQIQQEMNIEDRRAMFKIAIWLTKVVPVAIFVVYAFRPLIDYYELEMLGYITSYVAGLSLLPLIMFYVLSYGLGMCKWHRMILHYLSVSTALQIYDYNVGLPLTAEELTFVHVFLSILFGILILNQYCKDHECCHKQKDV